MWAISLVCLYCNTVTVSIQFHRGLTTTNIYEYSLIPRNYIYSHILFGGFIHVLVESFLLSSLHNPLDPMNRKKYIHIMNWRHPNTAQKVIINQSVQPSLHTGTWYLDLDRWFTDPKGRRSSEQIPGANETQGLSQEADEDVDHICPATDSQHQHHQTPEAHGRRLDHVMQLAGARTVLLICNRVTNRHLVTQGVQNS